MERASSNCRLSSWLLPSRLLSIIGLLHLHDIVPFYFISYLFRWFLWLQKHGRLKIMTQAASDCRLSSSRLPHRLTSFIWCLCFTILLNIQLVKQKWFLWLETWTIEIYGTGYIGLYLFYFKTSYFYHWLSYSNDLFSFCFTSWLFLWFYCFQKHGRLIIMHGILQTVSCLLQDFLLSIISWHHSDCGWTTVSLFCELIK